MNPTSKTFSLVSSFLIALTLLVSCNERKNDLLKPIHEVNLSLFEPDSININIQVEVQRQSITFILGEDRSTENPYYSEATKYFNENKSTHIVSTCRSLTEVRNYLINHAPSNKLPWGKINLVSHGDQWLGLSVKVTPDSRRATLERLQEYIDSGTFSPLSDSITDQETSIVVLACGIGNNKEFVEKLGFVFRSKSSVPQITAPRLFEFYSSDKGKSSNYQAKVWMVSFNKSEKPGNLKICNLLHSKYPEAKIDWQDALTRHTPRFGGDTYHYTFDIPVNIVIPVSENDSIPDFTTTEDKLRWINKQSEIQHILSKVQIPSEQFSWNLKKGFSKNKHGKRIQAISVKATCTMLCILKPLIDETSTTAGIFQPFVPAISDTVYYYTVKGKSFNIKS